MIQNSYSSKKINPDFYKTINITGESVLKPGYVYVPYKFITTKAILIDENGIHEIWQVGYGMRFKLWIYGLYNKSKKVLFRNKEKKGRLGSYVEY